MNMLFLKSHASEIYSKGKEEYCELLFCLKFRFQPRIAEPFANERNHVRIRMNYDFRGTFVSLANGSAIRG